MSGLLEILGLTVRFAGKTVVDGLNLTIDAGDTLALVGESGSGKSTAALALMRLLAPEADIGGKILFEGRDILDLRPKELRALRGGAVSMIFQDPTSSLNPVTTVGSQIAEAVRLHVGLTGAELRSRVVELLQLVEIPNAEARIGDYPHQFSGGQRQRIMIAMAVASAPKLLIADEPTTSLDATIQARILRLLDRLKRELSMSLLLITHDLGVVGQWANRVAVMYRGAKVEDGSTERIFTAPRHPHTRQLLHAASSLDETRHYTTSRANDGEDVSPRPTEVVSAERQRTKLSDIRNPLLSVRELSARYASKGRAVTAVNNVSFDIFRGETVGLVGESGCGKSTLSRAILRLVQNVGGRIVLDGVDIARASEAELRPFRPRMQMIFQDPHASLNPRMRIGDILDNVLIVGGVKNRDDRSRRIRHIVDRVELPSDTLERYVHEFSGGQKQRIGIARALLPRPALLICDEPVSSLDASIRGAILDLLIDVKAEFDLSYLFISHDLSVVRYIADRVLVMQDGEIVESGDRRDIWNSPRHPFTRSLIDAVPQPAFAFADAHDAAAPRYAL
ncbi:MAG: glutathione ABC transporter ATP-binding protein GsiA [Methylocystaceae bacterium]|nr:MAG: glutathione ABC transporter ATP-binding protein GsiA [Methylocystaceae bacterium]